MVRTGACLYLERHITITAPLLLMPPARRTDGEVGVRFPPSVLIRRGAYGVNTFTSTVGNWSNPSMCHGGGRGRRQASHTNSDFAIWNIIMFEPGELGQGCEMGWPIGREHSEITKENAI